MIATPTLTPQTAASQGWDVLIVGAGPAGGMSAYLLAKAGYRVLVVEKQSFPRYKVCGACLSPEAIAILESVGPADMLHECNAINIQRMVMGHAGRTIPVAWNRGQIVARDRLDDTLLSHAIGHGAAFLPETSASLGPVEGNQRLVHLQHHTGKSTARAAVVLLASGLREIHCDNDGDATSVIDVAPHSHIGIGTSLLAGSAGLAGFESGVLYMAVGRNGYVGQVLLEDGRLNIAGAIQPKRGHEHSSIGQAAADIVKQSGLPVPVGLERAVWKGTPPLTRHATTLAMERVFRIGDAAGYIEPFTGEGIGWALKCAVTVVPIVDQVLAGGTETAGQQWEATHRREVGGHQWTCRLLAGLLRHPRAIHVAAVVLSAFPGLTLPVVNVLNRRH